MKAALRQEISDRMAELAVDEFTKWYDNHERELGQIFPEEFLELQHDLEDILYRELNQWQ